MIVDAIKLLASGETCARCDEPHEPGDLVFAVARADDDCDPDDWESLLCIDCLEAELDEAELPETDPAPGAAS